MPDTTDEVMGFGGTFDLGPVADVAAAIDRDDGFYYVPRARAWLTRIRTDLLVEVEAVHGSLSSVGLVDGFVALYQKCPHLGCRVPECRSSGRFECPCHESAFTQLGEWVSGPSPRGMDRFPLAVVGGHLQVDTSVVLEGPARGVRALAGDGAGPSCLSA